MEAKRIMFCGPSGIGKTTLSNWISETYNIPFVSGSYSHLVPETKGLHHSDMISQPSIEQELELLHKRSNTYFYYTFNDKSFVTDRSYIDNVAYLIFKLSSKVHQHEIEVFEAVAKDLLLRDCTHLIIMECTNKMLNTWKVEDNNKRVVNTYFQWMISTIMVAIAKRLGMRKVFGHWHMKGIKILVLDAEGRDRTKNQKSIAKFLGKP